MKKGKIPPAAVRRMAQYLRLALSVGKENQVLTSTQLGSLTGYDAARVRNDCNYFGDFGLQGIGYERKTLISNLLRLYGIDRKQTLLVLGGDPVALGVLRRDLLVEHGFEIRTELDLPTGAAA